MDVPITVEEVKSGIDNLKNGKAAGPDGIVGEILKSSSHALLPFLTRFCEYIFEVGIFPFDWAKSILVPIFKKGCPNNTDNYRGISLSSIVSKVYTHILGERITNWTESDNIILEEQAGFRKSYSTVDHIFTLFAMVQSQFQKNRKLYVAFVDFRKAFDFVNREALWHVLHKSGIKKNTKMYNALRAIYNDVLASV